MRKIMKSAIVIFLLLAFGTSTAFLMYLHFFASKSETPSGVWTAQLHMTQRAAVTALDWLQEIEGVSVSLEDMESYMQNLTIKVNMEMTPIKQQTGTFRCSVMPDSYEACQLAAYEAFAAVFRDLLGERLHMAGYEGSIDSEAVEALAAETLGMSTVSYLMSCGPALLPSLEELQAEYDGAGDYEMTEDILIRRFEEGGAQITKEERYMQKGGQLILSGAADSTSSGHFFDHYPILYTLETDRETSGNE